MGNAPQVNQSSDLATVIEGLPLLVFVLDAEDRYVGFHAGRRDSLYAPPEAFLGRTISAVMPAPLAAQLVAATARARATGAEEVLAYSLDVPAGRRDFDCNFVPLAGGRVAVVTTDVTERRRRDERLRDTEERFRAAFESAPIGMATVSLGARLLDVNAALCAMLGRDRAWLLDRTVSEVVHPDDAALVCRQKDLLLSGARPFFRIEARCVHATGRAVAVRISAAMVPDPDGAPAYFIAQVEDVTEERRLEEQLRVAQRLESLGRLAGGVAHDYNNILTVILACAEQLERDLVAGRPCLDDVRDVRAAAERARDLTRQLLAFARRQIITPVALDPNALLRASETLLRRVLGEDVALALALAPDAWRIRCDPGQLEQVVLNLAVNAREAMPRGGRLTVETANVVLDADDAERHLDVAPGPYVMLRFTDTGDGMTDEVRARIFEPFFTTRPVGKGTGLGLATVYGIVRQSGGHLQVASEPGRGATFRVYLPRTDDAPPRPAQHPVAPRGGAETVLVVEDEPRVRAVTARALRSAGYVVLEAGSGPEALAVAAAAGAVQLLVTDVVMPGMSGADVARALTARVPGLRVLYVSGYSENTIAEHGVLAAGVEYLAKPFSTAALLARVRALLDAR